MIKISKSKKWQSVKNRFKKIHYEEKILKNTFINNTNAYARLLYYFDKNSEENATVIILGDVNVDGELNATDYLQIKSFLLSISSLEGVYFTAANVDCQGSIDATDYIKVKSHFLGSVDIYE